MNKNEIIFSFKHHNLFSYPQACCIVQIGEYVSRLSDEFKEKHDNISWKQIKGMRNFEVHNYGHFEFEVLWHTITEELPELKASLLPLI